MSSIDDMPHVMGEDGQFHAQDEEVDLSGTSLEGWVALGIFWVLGVAVFYQVVTRFLNCATPEASPLLGKPLVGDDPHGGGDLFPSTADPAVVSFLGWFP